MRLIDADKLKQHYAWWPENERTVLDQVVDAQPRIVPMAAEPGHWVEDEYGFIHCSRCGMEWDEPEHPETNYCPNCGSRMDGGDGDG